MHEDMNTRFRIWTVLLGAVLAAGVFGPAVKADATAETGRAILAKAGDAVVTVKLVIKAKQGGQSKEQKSEVTGTVIDPSGLTVLSLSQMDPGSLWDLLSPGGERGGGKLETEITDLKIILPDGKEIPAKVVLRDKDLDLAFLRPVDTPAAPLAAVDLAQAASPRILDEVISVNRLGKVASRASALSSIRIESVVEKPRTFYILEGGTCEASNIDLGCPIFAMDKGIVGITFSRYIKSDAGVAHARVVVPAGDILEASQQATAEASAAGESASPAPK